MLRRISSATGLLAVATLLLTGCFAPPQAAPSGASPAASSAPSSGPTCPDIGAEDLGVTVETTPADPNEIAESVGLGPVLDSTCAYGFEAEEYDGVIFVIVDPSEEAASEFLAGAVRTAADAGFEMFHAGVVGQGSTDQGSTVDGVAFFVAHYQNLDVEDGPFFDSQIEDLGLHGGGSVIIGSISIPVAG
jgi:hypothetical protein